MFSCHLAGFLSRNAYEHKGKDLFETFLMDVKRYMEICNTLNFNNMYGTLGLAKCN
jgi:hypothetical protein